MKREWPNEMTSSIISVFHTQVKKYGGRSMLMEKVNGEYRAISWNEVAQDVKDLALGLNALGIQFRDRVALVMTTQPNWISSDLAIYAAGGVNVPIYPTNKGHQIAFIVNDSEAKVIIVGSLGILKELVGVWDEIPRASAVIIPDGVKQTRDYAEIRGKIDQSKQVLERRELIALGREMNDRNPALYDDMWSRINKLDLASIIYTSGTTGNPKGVMLTHDNFLVNVRQGLERIEVKEDYINLSFLPLSHVLERTCGYYLPLVSGSTIAFAEDILTVAQNLAEVRPHFMVSVPRLYEKIFDRIMQSVNASSFLKKKIFFWAKELARENAKLIAERKSPEGFLKFKLSLANKLVFKKIKASFGGRLVWCISGGAPLGRELAEFFNGIGIRVLEGYGLTETSPVISFNNLENIRYGSIGQIVPDTEVKIADDGEILVKGPQVCQGYYNNQAATDELFEDGWMKTGDIGYIDENGFLFITDRKKDLIVTSGGKNVAPQPIESILSADRYIAQALTFGDKRHYLVAVVVPNFEQVEQYAKEKGIDFTSRAGLVKEERIRKLLAKRVAKALYHLPGYEQVKRIFIKDTEFTMDANELTPTLKIRRRFIYEKYREIFDNLYADTGDYMEVRYKIDSQVETGKAGVTV